MVCINLIVMARYRKFSRFLFIFLFFKPKLKIYFCKLLWATPCVVTCNRLSKSYFARTKKLFVPIISYLFWTNLEIIWQIFKINVILFNFFFQINIMSIWYIWQCAYKKYMYASAHNKRMVKYMCWLFDTNWKENTIV